MSAALAPTADVRILLASGNPGKLAELAGLLAPLGIELVSPADAGGLPAVDEDGATFAENARKKARSAALAARTWALADDSGLCVDALGGEPGVRSARFAGERATAEQNNRLLLERMRGVPAGRRTARFECALALARPDGAIAGEYAGSAPGRILQAPRGSGGFGYDPLFECSEPGSRLAGRSFAELSPAEKAEVGHRGRALRALVEGLGAVAIGGRAGASNG